MRCLVKLPSRESPPRAIASNSLFRTFPPALSRKYIFRTVRYLRMVIFAELPQLAQEEESHL
jgi:hypothetical protein